MPENREMVNQFRKTIVIIALTVFFSALPMAATSFTAEARSRKLPTKPTLTVSAFESTVVSLKWNKIKNPQKGFAVYRDGKCIAQVSAKKKKYTDHVGSGETHTYQIKVIKKKGKNKPKKTGKKSGKVTCATSVQKNENKSSGISSESRDGASGGGSVTPASDRSAYICTDYLGETHILWVDKSDKYYTAKTGGCAISNLAPYDKSVDGSWVASNNSSWKRNGSFYQKNSVTLQYWPTSTEVYVYNGSGAKSKLIIAENTGLFKAGYRNSASGPIAYYNINCVMIGEDRLSSYNQGIRTVAGVERNKITFGVGSETDEIYGFDGYIDGTVHVTAYYDFNNDGDWSSDEKVAAMTETITKSRRSSKALEIAQAAINEAGGSQGFDKDMYLIRGFMLNHYSYDNDNIDGSGLTARCNGGAEVLRVWSTYKYHVYGFVDCAPGGDGHVAFYPGIDGVEKGVVSSETTYYEAQGSH